MSADWPNLSSAASALCGGSLLQHYSQRATSEEECTTGTSHLMSWTCKVSIWKLMKDFSFRKTWWEFHHMLFRQLVVFFFFSPWQRQTFLPTPCFCEDRASSVEFESVKVEGCYRFDFVYQKKLLTAEQPFCFLPVSCSAAECYRRADMSAFNRPRWSSSGFHVPYCSSYITVGSLIMWWILTIFWYFTIKSTLNILVTFSE